MAPRNKGENRSELDSTASRPSAASWSTQATRIQSSSALPSVKIPEASMGSIGSPVASSRRPSDASNDAAIPPGSGPQSTIRGAARMRAGRADVRGVHDGAIEGSPLTGPRITSNSIRRSAIDAASGPDVDRSIQAGIGLRPTSPFVGFRPASPQNAAGMRTEPPPSVAVASGASPMTRAAALPPDEPPGDHSGAQGLRVAPKRRFEAKPSNANSGTFVFPTTIA